MIEDIIANVLSGVICFVICETATQIMKRKKRRSPRVLPTSTLVFFCLSEGGNTQVKNTDARCFAPGWMK